MSFEDKLIKWLTEEPPHKREMKKGVFRWRDFLSGFSVSFLLNFLLQRILRFFDIDGDFLILILLTFIVALLTFVVYYWKRKPGIARGVFLSFVLLFLNILGALLFVKMFFG